MQADADIIPSCEDPFKATVSCTFPHCTHNLAFVADSVSRIGYAFEDEMSQILNC